MGDDFDKAVEIITTATRSELSVMVVSGAFAALREAESDLRKKKR